MCAKLPFFRTPRKKLRTLPESGKVILHHPRRQRGTLGGVPPNSAGGTRMTGWHTGKGETQGGCGGNAAPLRLCRRPMPRRGSALPGGGGDSWVLGISISPPPIFLHVACDAPGCGTQLFAHARGWEKKPFKPLKALHFPFRKDHRLLVSYGRLVRWEANPLQTGKALCRPPPLHRNPGVAQVRVCARSPPENPSKPQIPTQQRLRHKHGQGRTEEEDERR